VQHNNQKKIAVINDFCGFGRCSLTVSIPIISALKVQCCPLPTSVFSNHTAFDSFFSVDFTEHMNAYIEEWKKLDLTFNGILTGYLGSVEQIDIVKHFLEHFKTAETITVIDPVMGDDGKLYRSYSPILADRMCTLIKHADIITPNLTEACILTKTEYNKDITREKLLGVCQKLNSMGPKKIVISGLDRGDVLENYIYESGTVPTVITEHKTGPCRAGTGDVFSSIIAADSVNGIELVEAVRHASAFIAKTLRKTSEIGVPSSDGICFEEFLAEI